MFCHEYLVDLNATQAAIRAGYAPKSAFVHASKLLSNAKVAELVKSLMEKRSKEVDLTASDVLRDINLVKVDAMGKVADKEGNMIMVNHAAALKALELQGKHLKMFVEKLEHTGPDGGPVQHSVTVKFV